MVRPRLVAFEAIGEDRLLWATTKSLPQDLASVGVFVLTIWWSLACEDTRNMDRAGREYRRWRWGACFDEVRSEAGTNGSVGKITLYREEFTFEVISGIVQFYPSPFHVVQLSLVCPIPMYVSNDPRVFEVD